MKYLSTMILLVAVATTYLLYKNESVPFSPATPPVLTTTDLNVLLPKPLSPQTDGEVRTQVKQQLKVEGKVELAELMEVFETQLQNFNKTLEHYDQVHHAYAELVATAANLNDPRVQVLLREVDAASEQILAANRRVTEVSKVLQTQYRAYASAEIRKYQ